MGLARLRLQAVTPATGGSSCLSSSLQAFVTSICGSGFKDLRQVGIHTFRGSCLPLIFLRLPCTHTSVILVAPRFSVHPIPVARKTAGFSLGVSATWSRHPQPVLGKTIIERKHSMWDACSTFPKSACFCSDSRALRQLFYFVQSL